MEDENRAASAPEESSIDREIREIKAQLKEVQEATTRYEKLVREQREIVDNCIAIISYPTDTPKY